MSVVVIECDMIPLKDSYDYDSDDYGEDVEAGCSPEDIETYTKIVSLASSGDKLEQHKCNKGACCPHKPPAQNNKKTIHTKQGRPLPKQQKTYIHQTKQGCLSTMG